MLHPLVVVVLRFLGVAVGGLLGSTILRASQSEASLQAEELQGETSQI